ncbi:MAG: FHA domain-containing protein [Kofleriaceae bacterium]|nr:FHA domain-containing protein [Kofleriaceae bacterium]
MSPCDGMIPDHVRSTVDATDAEGWVVDGFGNPHALPAKSVVGRNHDGQLVLLAASVSREHAELRQTDTGWTVRDLGSRNGTFVDGLRVHGRVTLPSRVVIKIGDVALWFLAEVMQEPVPPPSMATGSIAGGLVRFTTAHAGFELCLVGSSDTSSGGSLLAREAGAETWSERSLPPLEFQLLRALCARANEEASSPSMVRGCVATKQLARDLPFQSKYANEENVRQVVRRLRAELREVGAEGLLAVAPGRGYYLASPVSTGGR